MDGANILLLFHNLAKSSESKAQGVKAVQVASNNKGSVVCDWSTIDPSDNSQYQDYRVDYKTCKVKPVPTVTKSK